MFHLKEFELKSSSKQNSVASTSIAASTSVEPAVSLTSTAIVPAATSAVAAGNSSLVSSSISIKSVETSAKSNADTATTTRTTKKKKAKATLEPSDSSIPCCSHSIPASRRQSESLAETSTPSTTSTANNNYDDGHEIKRNDSKSFFSSLKIKNKKSTKSKTTTKEGKRNLIKSESETETKSKSKSKTQTENKDSVVVVGMDSNINRVLNSGQRHPLNGVLYKYTNVMKGWQYRWFTVDAQTGILSYYLYDSSTIVGEDVPPPQHILLATPRGQVHLAGAVVCPSDEDSKTFSINCASGDTLKLRAVDARARQEWVNGLRAVVESHTKAIDISNSSPLPPRELLAASDAMTAARQALFLTEQSNASLARVIEGSEVTNMTPNDPDLLMLKALSTASTQCLHQCLSLLQRHEEIENTLPPTAASVK